MYMQSTVATIIQQHLLESTWIRHWNSKCGFLVSNIAITCNLYRYTAASISGYVYLYSIYYFAFKTKMTGFFQTCFYFGYTVGAVRVEYSLTISVGAYVTGHVCISMCALHLLSYSNTPPKPIACKRLVSTLEPET
jgi:hypothetical protein